jgi:hypothetical protein
VVLKKIAIGVSLLMSAILYLSGCYDSSTGGPPAPYNLEAELDGGAVYLTWYSVPCDRYHLERSVVTSVNWIEISTRLQNQNFYRDEVVYPGETFYYRVRSYDASYDPRYSAYSNEVFIYIE